MRSYLLGRLTLTSRFAFSYDLPSSPVEYLHRIGRTGRNGRSGKAVTFFTSADAPLIKPIVNVMRNSSVDVPEYLSKIKNLSKKQKKTLKRKPVERKGINEAAAQGYAAPTVTGKKRKREEGGKGASSKNSKAKGGKKEPVSEYVNGRLIRGQAQVLTYLPLFVSQG